MPTVVHNAVNIADYFALKGILNNLPVTQMALQKMVYFAHGLFLAETNGTPLIVDTFQAWKFGPVVPDIYHRYKLYGDSSIQSDNLLIDCGFEGFNEDIHITPEQSELLNSTWDILKDINPIQLSNWTHKPGSAWSKVYNPSSRHTPIPNSLIEEDFKEFILAN